MKWHTGVFHTGCLSCDLKPPSSPFASFGQSHSGVAATLHELGTMYLVQGQAARAEPLLLRALAIRERVLLPSHPYLRATRARLAALYRQTGQEARADALAQAAGADQR